MEAVGVTDLRAEEGEQTDGPNRNGHNISVILLDICRYASYLKMHDK